MVEKVVFKFIFVRFFDHFQFLLALQPTFKCELVTFMLTLGFMLRSLLKLVPLTYFNFKIVFRYTRNLLLTTTV